MSEVQAERQLLTDIYPPEIVEAFPTFGDEVAAFLERNAGKVATLETPAAEVENYAEELQALVRTVAAGLKDGQPDPVTLYLQATQPARKAGIIRSPQEGGQVGLILGKHRYHILERVGLEGEGVPAFARSLLLLLQRIPKGEDSGTEVHGVRKVKDDDPPELRAKAKHGLVPAEIGGVEVYLPLVDDIRFHVNKNVFQPKALEGLVTILPGDTHNHIKKEGSGPVRLLLIGGFGFSRAPKTSENFEVEAVKEIPRFTHLK